MIHQIKNNTGSAKSYGSFTVSAGATVDFWDDSRLIYSSNIDGLFSEFNDGSNLLPKDIESGDVEYQLDNVGQTKTAFYNFFNDFKNAEFPDLVTTEKTASKEGEIDGSVFQKTVNGNRLQGLDLSKVSVTVEEDDWKDNNPYNLQKIVDEVGSRLDPPTTFNTTFYVTDDATPGQGVPNDNKRPYRRLDEVNAWLIANDPTGTTYPYVSIEAVGDCFGTISSRYRIVTINCNGHFSSLGLTNENVLNGMRTYVNNGKVNNLSYSGRAEIIISNSKVTNVNPSTGGGTISAISTSFDDTTTSSDLIQAAISCTFDGEISITSTDGSLAPSFHYNNTYREPVTIASRTGSTITGNRFHVASLLKAPLQWNKGANNSQGSFDGTFVQKRIDAGDPTSGWSFVLVSNNHFISEYPYAIEEIGSFTFPQQMVAFGNRYWNDEFANLTLNVIIRDFENKKIETESIQAPSITTSGVYNILDTDKIVACQNATATTVVLPAGVLPGFEVEIVNDSVAGIVTFSGDIGVVIDSGGRNRITTTKEIAKAIHLGSDRYVLHNTVI